MFFQTHMPVICCPQHVMIDCANGMYTQTPAKIGIELKNQNSKAALNPLNNRRNGEHIPAFPNVTNHKAAKLNIIDYITVVLKNWPFFSRKHFNRYGLSCSNQEEMLPIPLRFGEGGIDFSHGLLRNRGVMLPDTPHTDTHTQTHMHRHTCTDTHAQTHTHTDTHAHAHTHTHRRQRM